MQADANSCSQDVLALFERVVVEVVPGLDPRQIEPTCELTDLDASSLALMEALAEMEDALKIRLRDADLMNLSTVGDVVSLMERRAKQTARPLPDIS